MPFVDPDRIEQSDRVQAASFALFERRIINPPISFRNDRDTIDCIHAPSPSPVNDGSSSLPVSDQSVSNTLTYVLHVQCRISVREVDIVHHADVFATLPAPVTRGPALD